MIECCISLIRKKMETRYRNKLYQRYITDILKGMLEAYYSGHNSKIEIPVYKDLDDIMDSQKESEENQESAEDVKNRIFNDLEKFGRVR